MTCLLWVPLLVCFFAIVDVGGQTCLSSLECNEGTVANCCGGVCTTFWECPNQECAAKETYNTKIPEYVAANRYCLINDNPCASQEAGIPLCLTTLDACMNTNLGDGSYYCSSCPPGLYGSRCEYCNASAACTFGTVTCCCGGSCTTPWECTGNNTCM